jgi:hypothetical protein
MFCKGLCTAPVADVPEDDACLYMYFVLRVLLRISKPCSSIFLCVLQQPRFSSDVVLYL